MYDESSDDSGSDPTEVLTSTIGEASSHAYKSRIDDLINAIKAVAKVETPPYRSTRTNERTDAPSKEFSIGWWSIVNQVEKYLGSVVTDTPPEQLQNEGLLDDCVMLTAPESKDDCVSLSVFYHRSGRVTIHAALVDEYNSNQQLIMLYEKAAEHVTEEELDDRRMLAYSWYSDRSVNGVE